MIEVKGNGNIVSREISISTFIRLHLGCSGTIELHQSDEEKIIVEADENLQDFFVVVNAGRTLYVSNEAKLKRLVFTKCVVKVFIRQMDMLYVRNPQGNIVCPNLITLTQPLEIKVQSVGNTQLSLAVPSIKMLCQSQGNITLDGSCEKLDIKNQNDGDLDSSKLKAGEVTIKNMANGNVRLHADTSIKIAHYGNGYVHYSGDATIKDVKQYGNGEVKRVKEKELV